MDEVCEREEREKSSEGWEKESAGGKDEGEGNEQTKVSSTLHCRIIVKTN